METLIRAALILVALAAIACRATAAIVTLSGQSFNELSGPETLSPAFNLLGGQTTVNNYHGLVEVLVSGTGLNNVNDPIHAGDAFYQFNSSSNQAIGLSSNSLRIGSQSQIADIPGNWPFVPNNSERQEAGSVHPGNLAIVYDVSSFAVADQNALDAFSALAPIYSSNHSYHFVMNLGSYSGTLTLGNGDGFVSDNSSTTWNISLWPVQAVSSGPFLRGDYNRDFHVDTADIPVMLNVLSDLNPYKKILQYTDSQLLSIQDVNGDGRVSNSDLQALVGMLRTGGGSAAAAVPEPNSLILLVLGLPWLAYLAAKRQTSEIHSNLQANVGWLK